MKHLTTIYLGLMIAVLGFMGGVQTHNAVFGETETLEKTYTFEDIKPIFEARCKMCHNANSGRGDWQDYDQAFKKRVQIKLRVKNKTMPMGNVTRMTEEERYQVIMWVDQGAKK